MLFYQYLPLKLEKSVGIKLEKRLHCFKDLINKIKDDFVTEFGLQRYYDSYMYLTVKHMYQPPGNSYNRHGYHTDGFMTDDVNYIWCDNDPTTFNTSNLN